VLAVALHEALIHYAVSVQTGRPVFLASDPFDARLAICEAGVPGP
jgi:hypothetical protein